MKNSKDLRACVRDHGAYYEMYYPYDYRLDELLEKGVSNTAGLIRFVQKTNGSRRPMLRPSGYACTTFTFTDKNGHHLMGRNFDYKESGALIVHTEPGDGYRSIGIADMNMMLYGLKHRRFENSDPAGLYMAPFACMDGVNEKGLAIAVLELHARPTTQRSGRIPITTTVMIRAVLDKCASVEEAISLFSRYDMHAALFSDYHFQITDASGESAVVEYIDNKMRVLCNCRYAMNFYLSSDGDNRKTTGYYREHLVRESLLMDQITDNASALELLHRCKKDHPHRIWRHRVTTLWSAIYDCTSASVEIEFGSGRDPIYASAEV